MKKKNIWQLAFIKDNICPVCGNHILEHKPCAVMIAAPDQASYKPYSFNVLFCSNCGLPFADSGVSENVLKATGCWLRTFSPKKNCSAESIRNQMNYRKKGHPHSCQKKERSTGFERIPSSAIIWKTSKTLCSQSADLRVCPKCHASLHSDYTLIPISKREKAKVPGMLCDTCGIIYVKESSELTKIMRDSPLTKGFTLDGRELWHASAMEEETKRKAETKALWAERRRRLHDVPDSVVMVCLKIRCQVQEYIITNHELSPTGCNIFYYKSAEGRELLSAAFADERAKKGILFGNVFQVLSVVFAKNHIRNLPNHILPAQLTIKADGGYASSVRNRNREVVDLLIYSPLTQRYELMRGTYDKKQDYCYTDIGIFRRYVREYGNPRASIDFAPAIPCRTNNYDLRSESVLMGYGYNVSEANQLSDRERHEILAEIVDLEILTVHQIVNLIDFNCRLHCSERYYLARSKWMSDKNFIENYRVNPNRFLIAQFAK